MANKTIVLDERHASTPLRSPRSGGPATRGSDEGPAETEIENTLQPELTPAQIQAIIQRNAELEARDKQVAQQLQQIEEEKALLAAKRVASTFEAENDAVTMASEKREADATNRKLRAEPKFRINIPVDMRLLDPKHPDRVQTETFQINGGDKYVVECGEDREVPESIYLLAVASGKVRPQRPQDALLYPRVHVKPGKAAGLIGD